ncbi:MAG: response regulator [Deltaproteobacteria bacterium]|nr:response regulator [Deltaproteobacteria bacterium]
MPEESRPAFNSGVYCVMVVDDDVFSRSSLAVFLQKNGYRVCEAEDGARALSLLNNCPCDLILLDMDMPVMDGIETCRRLRQRQDYADIPILMITGLDDDESIDQAFAVGATDYLTKPFHWTVLRNRVRYLITQLYAEREQRRLLRELSAALDKVKALTGLLPICAACKKIRDDDGYWQELETYMGEHSELQFTHGICPECRRKLYSGSKKPD